MKNRYKKIYLGSRAEDILRNLRENVMLPMVQAGYFRTSRRGPAPDTRPQGDTPVGRFVDVVAEGEFYERITPDVLRKVVGRPVIVLKTPKEMEGVQEWAE